MDMKLKKEIALEWVEGLMHGGWDDEMLSVHQMKKYGITPEEHVEVTMWVSKKIQEMFG